MLHRGAVQPYDRGAVQYQPDPQYSSYPKAVWLGDGLYWDNQQQSVLIGDGIFQSDGSLVEGDDGFVEAAILPIFQSKIFHSKVINVRGSLVGK